MFQQQELIAHLLTAIRESVDAQATSDLQTARHKSPLDTALAAVNDVMASAQALASLDARLPYAEFAATLVQRSVSLSNAMSDMLASTKSALSTLPPQTPPELISETLSRVQTLALASGALLSASAAKTPAGVVARLRRSVQSLLDLRTSVSEQLVTTCTFTPPAIAPSAEASGGEKEGHESEWEVESSSSDSDYESSSEGDDASLASLLTPWAGAESAEGSRPGSPATAGGRDPAGELAAIAERVALLVKSLESAAPSPATTASMKMAQGIAELIAAATRIQESLPSLDSTSPPSSPSTNPFSKRSRSGTVTRKYMENAMYSEGLISAARHCGDAMSDLFSTSDAVQAGQASLVDATVRSKAVKAAICQILAASRAKTEPGSDLHASLTQAASTVETSVADLLSSLSASESDHVSDNAPPAPAPMSMTGARIAELELQTKIMRLEEELRTARQDLGALRRAQYQQST